MTARPMTEGEYALRLAASIADAEDNNRMVWSSTAGTVALARALLSTSSAVRGMREAAEMIRARLNDIEDAAKKCDSLYGVRIRQVVEDMRSDLFDEVKRQTAEKKL